MLSSDKMCWIKPACGGAPPAPTSGHVAVAIGSSLAIFGGYCYTRVGTQFWYTGEEQERSRRAEGLLLGTPCTSYPQRHGCGLVHR